MAGYHFLKQLNNAAVLTASPAIQTFNLPPFQLLIYRLVISAGGGGDATLQVNISTVDSNGNRLVIATTPIYRGAVRSALYIQSALASVAVQMVIGGTTPSFTVTDELEAQG